MLSGAERQARYRERMRAQAAVTDLAPVTASPSPAETSSPAPSQVAVTPAEPAVTLELSVGLQAEVTEPASVTEPVTDQDVTRIVDDVRVEPVTVAASSLAGVTVNFSPAELRRLDQWRRCQYDRPSRAEAMRLLVAEALKVPAA